MPEEITKGHEQHDLYVSDTILNGVHHKYKTDLLFTNGSHSSGHVNGIYYSYSGVTKNWTISGTAIEDSTLVLLNSPYSIPSYLDRTHEFRFELDDFSEGQVIPLKITLYQSSNNVEILYPSGTNILPYQVQPTSFKISDDCTGIKVEYFVEKGREVNSEVLYHFYDMYDDRITHYEYTYQSGGSRSTFQVVISGGSGSGALSYQVENITGEASVSGSGSFNFLKSGTVWVKIQKAKSTVGTTKYEESKILVLEVTLEQSQVWIKVHNDVVKNIGDSIPSSQSQSGNYTVEGLSLGDFLLRDPDIYFVYESDDFYKFDLMSKANSETRLNNGIKYINQDNGSWKISGRLTTSPSTYGLILSSQEIPSYIDRSHTYQFQSTGLTSTVRIRATWYFQTSTGVSTLSNFYSDAKTKFVVPLDDSSRKLVGFSLEFYITTTASINKTVKVKILDLSEPGRFIDNTTEGEYPIAARNAQVPNTAQDGYKSKIQYRSKKLKYVSESENPLFYGMFLYDSGSSNISDISYQMSVSQSSAAPRTKILIHVKAQAGTYFLDGWNNTYNIGDGTYPDFDYLWDTGTVVSLGSYSPSFASGYFRILGATSSTGDVSQPVPFHRISATTDSSDSNKVYEGMYEFMMPSSTIKIAVVSYYISTSIYYQYYPYCDVGMYGDPLTGPAVILPSTIYRDALMFCRWARQEYFGETNAKPLMQGRVGDTGPYTGWFYVANPSSYTDPHDQPIIRHYVTRKEVCWVLRRMTHDTEYPGTGESVDMVSRYPDILYEIRATYQKDPYARLFEYAGYPPENGVTVEWTQNLDQKFAAESLTADGLRWKPYVMVQDPDNPSQYIHVNEGTIDDYLYDYTALSTTAWNAWIGVLNGMSNTVAATESFATFQEIATLLWRYAKFRQFDVMGGDAYEAVDDSTASEWAKNGPIKWLISRGLTTGYHINTSINTPNGGQKMKPKDYIDRADFAYMIMKFCQMYAW